MQTKKPELTEAKAKVNLKRWLGRFLKALGKTFLLLIVGMLATFIVIALIYWNIMFLFILFVLVLGGVFYTFWESA